ncbi:hypothetical protein ACVR0P_07000 [Streptococcus castoreus]|uniref:transcriptional regulator n=1 Tax=Streptococcus castoreus TaxID=254786 RepID=UPI0012EBED08|nr:transcriptional regulator [Streptococcus castoreus]
MSTKEKLKELKPLFALMLYLRSNATKKRALLKFVTYYRDGMLKNNIRFLI